MAMKKGGNCFIVWLLMLTATVQGYRSCSELQANNQTGPFQLNLNKQTYNVSCNMSVTPAWTIIQVKNSKDIVINNPSRFNGQPTVFLHSVNYNIANDLAIRELIKLSENCRQYVSYRCKNAPLFGDVSNPSGSSWTSTKVGGEANLYWSNCDIKNNPCNCDGKDKETIDKGSLTKKQDLPVSTLRFGGYKADSDVSFTIGDLVCYGDEQKNAFFFENLNSFLALNLSSNIKEIEFKFKPSTLRNENKVITTIEMKDNKQIKVKYADEINLEITETFTNTIKKFKAVKEEWHSVKLKIVEKTLSASVDGNKPQILVANRVDLLVAKLSFGDPSHSCTTLIGCIKDLKIDGKDATTALQQSKMKEFVGEGCHNVYDDECKPTKLFVGGGGGGEEEKEGGGEEEEGSGKEGRDGEDGEDGDNNTAVIVIMVIFLLLLILLLVAFFVTWYLKRNKGVYQTHEGSAENIHGDTDNLTLVSRPSEQEAENEKSKEYYL